MAVLPVPVLRKKKYGGKDGKYKKAHKEAAVHLPGLVVDPQ